MESKEKLNQIDIKNRKCYYFDDIIRAMDKDSDFDFSDALLDDKLYKEKYENVLIYDISCKTSTGAKPLRNRFNKIDEFIKTLNGIWCLVLFDYGCFYKICDRIKYLINKKVELQIILSVSNFEKIRIYLYYSLPIEKILTFHVIILIKSAVNKKKNNCYCNIFLEKDLYKSESDTQYF